MEAIQSTQSNYWNVSRSQLNDSQTDVFEEFVTEAMSSEDTTSEDTTSSTSNTSDCPYVSSGTALSPDEFAEASLQPTIPAKMDQASSASELLGDDSPITLDWLTEHPGAANMIAENTHLATYLSENTEQAEKFMQGASEAKEVIYDARATGVAEQVSEYFGEDSPITEEWLMENYQSARLLGRHPDFADQLNQSTDNAELFMQGSEQEMELFRDFVDEASVDRAVELLGDDSPITQEWLQENLDSSRFLASHPGFSSYLSENSEQAEGFLDIEA